MESYTAPARSQPRVVSPQWDLPTYNDWNHSHPWTFLWIVVDGRKSAHQVHPPSQVSTPPIGASRPGLCARAPACDLRARRAPCINACQYTTRRVDGSRVGLDREMSNETGWSRTPRQPISGSEFSPTLRSTCLYRRRTTCTWADPGARESQAIRRICGSIIGNRAWGCFV